VRSKQESCVTTISLCSEDQGPAASRVPDCVYGVIDLYGQASQATIIDVAADFRSPDGGAESEATSATLFSAALPAGATSLGACGGDLRFHHLHGRNARISNSGITSSRPNALGEFNDAIVITNRPLRDGEHFEIVIERMVERWSGSIEAGVTLIRPEDLEFPSTMTDIDYDTWMLSGSAVMRDGQTVRNGYCCDLDTLGVGSRLGVVRHGDGTIHYTINGEDQGIACDQVPPNIYAVIDLYGQCAQVRLILPTSLAQLCLSQVSIVHTPASHGLAAGAGQETSVCTSALESSACQISLVACSEVSHRFGACRAVELVGGGQTAVRKDIKGAPQKALAVATSPLLAGDVFEVQIDEVQPKWAGSLRIGVTTEDPASIRADIFAKVSSRSSTIVWMEGTSVFLNGKAVKVNYCSSLTRLSSGDRVGVSRNADGILRFTLNGDALATAAEHLPFSVTPIVGLNGRISRVTITSMAVQRPRSPELREHAAKDRPMESKTHDAIVRFHDNHGKNVILAEDGRSASRQDSYNQGLLFSHRPLQPNEFFTVQLDKVKPMWSSSLAVGITALNPDKLHLPVSALGLKRLTQVVCGNAFFVDGRQESQHGAKVEGLEVGQTIGVAVDACGRMRMKIDGVERSFSSSLSSHSVTKKWYALIDLYGQAEEIAIATDDGQQENAALLTPEPPLINGRCRYLDNCSHFVKSLGLPAKFFSSEERQMVCYCVSCHKASGEPHYASKGEPPKEHASPVGWCRLELALPTANRGASSALIKWHTAYFGTKPCLIRRMLDASGQQLLPASSSSFCPSLSKCKGKEDDSDVPPLLFTPTLKYLTTCPSICPPSPFKHGGKSYSAKVALQVEINPGSYKIGSPTVKPPLPVSPDSRFKLEETEWLTKEKGNTFTTALLVQLQSL